MKTLTIYQNNDHRQPKTFTGRTPEAVIAQLDAWLTKHEPDVCAELGEDDGTGPEPLYALNYCESERDWEWRERISDVDLLDSGTFADMKGLFIQHARLNIETK